MNSICLVIINLIFPARSVICDLVNQILFYHTHIGYMDFFLCYDIIVTSLWHHCDIIVTSLWHQCDIIVTSLWSFRLNLVNKCNTFHEFVGVSLACEHSEQKCVKHVLGSPYFTFIISQNSYRIKQTSS